MHRFIDIRLIVLVALWGAGTPAAAQTIADYSRMQRAQIEASIQRQTPVTTPLPTLMPGAVGGTSATAVPLPTKPTVPAPAGAVMPGAEPPSQRLAVSGVVAFHDRRLAEVTFDGVSYFLGAGDSVPGSAWTVKSVTAGEVVLASAGRRAATRTFHLGTAGR